MTTNVKKQITISDELREKVDALAKAIGISRSSMACVLIGEALQARELKLERTGLAPSFLDKDDHT